VDEKLTATLHLERLPLADLKPHPRNPREHPAPGTEEWEKLKKSLVDAYFDPVVWNRRNGLLVSGHLRRSIFLELGYTHADAVVVDWDEPRHLARMIAANQAAGKDSRDELRTIIEELQVGGFDLALTGLPDAKLAKLLPQVTAPEPAWVAPAGTDVPIETRVGDIYRLGPHRLLCGDSREAAAVQAVLAGDVVDQLVTDPPYGIDYVAKETALKGSSSHIPIANDNLKDYRKFFGAFLAPIPFAPKNTAYVFMSGQELHNLRLAFTDAGLTWADYLIWVKNGQVMGRKDYHPKHEFIVYGWKGSHRFYGGIGAAVIDDEIPADKMSKAALVAEVTALRQFRSSVLREDKPLVNDLHPTMKPVNLIRRLLIDGSAPGSIVFDPFNGSGSTLLACDLVERRYRGIEQEPVHCDTTVRRWLTLGGGRRVLRSRPLFSEAGTFVGYAEQDVTHLFASPAAEPPAP
jgi:DNA modification methylase